MARKRNGANGSVKEKTSSKRTSLPEGDEPWEIRSILSSRLIGSKVLYTVLWDDDSTTEEPRRNLIPGCEESVVKFHQARPGAPMPKKIAKKLLPVKRASVPSNDVQAEMEHLKAQNAMLLTQNNVQQSELNGLKSHMETLKEENQTLKSELTRLGNAVVAWGVACSRTTTADSNTLLASFGHDDSDMTNSDTTEHQLPAHLQMLVGRQM